MKNQTAQSYFLARHAERKKGNPSQDFQGISVCGVRQVRENTDKLVDLIKDSPENSVFFLGACSEHQRTDATALAYTKEIENKFQDCEEVMVHIPKEVQGWQNKKANADFSNMSTQIPYNDNGSKPIYQVSRILKQIKRTIDSNPGKKIIICLPLYLKQFSFFRHGWINSKTYDFIDSVEDQLKQGNSQEAYFDLTRKWLNNELTNAPNPEKTIEEFEKGINRYENFVKRLIKKRPYCIGIFSHAWEAEAYIAKQATGNLSPKSLDKVFQGNSLATSESAVVYQNSKETKVDLRDKTWRNKNED